MLLPDVWAMDSFFAKHPPVDLLVAAYLGFKAPEKADQKTVSARERARKNAQALMQMPPRKNVKNLSEMPEFLRTPEKMAAIERMKAEWQTKNFA